MIEEKLRKIGSLAYSRFETVVNSYELARLANKEGIEGCFVECGVAAGSQMAAMAFACDVDGKKREMYLFDSFCGIPMAGPKDDQQPGIGAITHDTNVKPEDLLRSSGVAMCGVDGVKRNMSNWEIPTENMKFVEGWFQNTVKETETGPIAILRLDGDLYESTKVCLEALYERVVPGGFIIIDDYALKGCKTAVHEFMEKELTEDDYNTVPTTDKVIWWRKV
jgi:hypothetical protein